MRAGWDGRAAVGSTTIKSTEPVEIAVAILWREQLILARRRRADERLPGLWEFPGGKIEPAESPADAARREVREEMGVEAVGLTLRETIVHAYDDRSVRIHVFEGGCTGEPASPDGAEWAWLTPTEFAALPIPEANRKVAARLAAAHRKTMGNGG